MTTYTIFGVATDGYITGFGATYSTVRAGTAGLQVTAGPSEEVIAGQETGFNVYEGFASFDLSSVVGVSSVATISLYGSSDYSTTDFTLQARLSSWTAGGLTTADYVAGASLSALTQVASRSSAGWSTAGYNAITSDAALLTAVDLHGTLALLFCSDRMVAGTTPTNSEALGWYPAQAAGTTNDPKIDITSAAAATADTSGMFLVF